MESAKLKKVPLEAMSKEFREESEYFWKIFDRGVRAAKAENERLGLVLEDAGLYAEATEASPVTVAEPESSELVGDEKQGSGAP